MKTSIEQLPIELWIEILSYLEAHVIFHAFTNLNRHFDYILTSDHLLFNVELGKTDRNPLEYTVQPYWSKTILNRIIHLQPLISQQLSHIPEFLRWHCSELHQLKSLTMKLRGRQISAISNVLPHLLSLHYLSIKCVPNQILLDAILVTPNLNVAQFEFSRPITSINIRSDKISPLKILDIQLEDDSYSSIMILFLSHMPKLQWLQMRNYDIYVKNREWIFFDSLFTLSELHTLYFKCFSNYSTPVIFQNFHRNLPAIKYAYLTLNFDFINEDLVDHLIHHWWPILETVERIDLRIKCRNDFIIVYDHMQIMLNHLQSLILAMNNQYNGSIETKWDEKFYLGIRTIEISMCKVISAK